MHQVTEQERVLVARWQRIYSLLNETDIVDVFLTGFEEGAACAQRLGMDQHARQFQLARELVGIHYQEVVEMNSPSRPGPPPSMPGSPHPPNGPLEAVCTAYMLPLLQPRPRHPPPPPQVLLLPHKKQNDRTHMVRFLGGGRQHEGRACVCVECSVRARMQDMTMASSSKQCLTGSACKALQSNHKTPSMSACLPACLLCCMLLLLLSLQCIQFAPAVAVSVCSGRVWGGRWWSVVRLGGVRWGSAAQGQ